MVKVVSLTGTLAHAGKHGIASMLCGNVADQLLNQHCLAHARAAEQTNLTTLLIRTEQIHHLDTRLQQFCLCGLFLKLGSRSVYGFIAHPFRSRLIINRLSQNVKDTPQGLFTHRNRNRSAGRNRIHSSHQTVGAAHGNTSDRIVTQMLRYLNRQFAAVSGRNTNRFVDLGKLTLVKADVKHRTHDLGNLSFVFSCHFYLFPARLRGHIIIL